VVLTATARSTHSKWYVDDLQSSDKVDRPKLAVGYFRGVRQVRRFTLSCNSRYLLRIHPLGFRGGQVPQLTPTNPLPTHALQHQPQHIPLSTDIHSITISLYLPHDAALSQAVETSSDSKLKFSSVEITDSALSAKFYLIASLLGRIFAQRRHCSWKAMLRSIRYFGMHNLGTSPDCYDDETFLVPKDTDQTKSPACVLVRYSRRGTTMDYGPLAMGKVSTPRLRTYSKASRIFIPMCISCSIEVTGSPTPGGLDSKVEID